MATQTTHYPFSVVQPHLSRGEQGWLETATVISRHRTLEAAEEAIERANRRLRRQPGQQTSWHDWHVREDG